MTLAKLVQLLQGKENRKSASAPEGLRIYAIGDVHGRSDLLDALAKRIEADLATAPGDVVTVFLGDYVDRGGDSAGVIERLAQGDFPTPYHTLRGNHEEVLLKFFEEPAVLESWRKFGGLETLHSYGVDVFDVMRGMGYDRARDELAARMPEAHRAFLQETILSVDYGDYFFCHAGVRPDVPLELQTPQDLLWIREEFLRFRGSFEKVVVHGHTPVPEPEMLAGRINVDTGAFATSILTAVALEGTSRRLLSTKVRSAAA
jgi:serine/threonine protein phosphatase 1